MNYRRTLTIAAIAALAAGGLYWVFRPKPVLVETAAVSEQHFVATVEEDGRTRVRDRYVVSAPLGGRFLRPAFRAGDQIMADQTLGTIIPNVPPLLDPRLRRELEERVGAAEAGLEEAKALQDRARVLVTQTLTDLGRTQQLRERGYAALAQLDRDQFAHQAAERALSAADRRRHAAEHALEEAQAALKRMDEPALTEGFKIQSPITGRILRILQESEASVTPGASLFELGDPLDLEIIADLLTGDAAQIQPGANVSIERWGGDHPLSGRVRRVEPSGFTKVSPLGVEEQRVWVVIDITSQREQWLTLGDGFRVDTKITTRELERATVAPVGALFRRGEDWYVFVVEGGRANLRRIEAGPRSDRLAVIAQGLKPGDEVVVFLPASLSDGSRVKTQ
jgi:HlyD family secretion protein